LSTAPKSAKIGIINAIIGQVTTFQVSFLVQNKRLQEGKTYLPSRSNINFVLCNQL
jgi:hypothetical protein